MKKMTLEFTTQSGRVYPITDQVDVLFDKAGITDIRLQSNIMLEVCLFGECVVSEGRVRFVRCEDGKV